MPAATIARLYYEPELAPHAATPEAMDRYLRTMRDELVTLALRHGSSVLADHLKNSIRQHGSAKLTAVTLRWLNRRRRWRPPSRPQVTPPVHLWFRPLVARRVGGEGITTLGALVDYCNARGGSWWRAVPRIGALRARSSRGCAITSQPSACAWPRMSTRRRWYPPPAHRPPSWWAATRAHRAWHRSSDRRCRPRYRRGGGGGDGSHRSTNRAAVFAFIRAPHDLAAIQPPVRCLKARKVAENSRSA
jgi:hypothetical protein